MFELGDKINGICSKTTRSDHAVNLWVSTYSMTEDGKTAQKYAGVRHAVNSAHGLPEGELRNQAALMRAKQVITAALTLQPDKLARARKGQTVDVALSSISLLTPVDFGPSTEKSQLQDQRRAWDTLRAAPAVELDIKNEQGNNIKIKLDVAAFNFGVNGLSQGILKLGNDYSDKMNLSAMKQLLGDDLSPEQPVGG